MSKQVHNMDFLKNICLLPFFFALASGSADYDLPENGTGITYSIPEQPELATGYNAKPGRATSEFSVAAAHPIATDAGYQIILAGGSAIDAAIAVQLVLSLVEPQSSGIGGGAFVLVWDDKELHAYNGRETAPSNADGDLFLDEAGRPLSFSAAVRSGLSVGVPGTLALLKTIHDAHGVLPWEQLFNPAITLADTGFRISPRLHSQIEQDNALRNDPIAGAYFFDATGNAHPAGYKLKNPAYAEILRNVARNGISAFYEGVVAEDIEARVSSHERPGRITTADIAAYQALDLRTAPICSEWRDYKICGFPPPSSGHIAIMQILYILDYLEPVDEALANAIPTADWLHQFMEASKLAFADRNQYIADPLFTEAPADNWQSMLDADYLSKRADLVAEASMGTAEPGNPREFHSAYGVQMQQPESGTSHISIVDLNGNAISMTTTIESGFGSRIMSDGGTSLSGGFLLNNELTDFSLRPVDDAGNPVANRVEPGKRPRSSMSPTFVFKKDTGEFVASLGSPGGAAIIHYTIKALIGMLDWGLNAQEAINLPNFANFNGPSVLEQGYFDDELIEALEAMGHVVNVRELTSGLQAIQKTDDGYFGGSDPRREGVVMGD